MLIYIPMTMYLAAFVLFALRRKEAGRILFATGFLFAFSAVLLRWQEVSRIPVRGMFEIFLFTGALVYPVHLLCRDLPGIDSDKIDSALGFLLLFPAGFVFSAETSGLPPSLRYWAFGPHVACYLLGYVLMFKAGAAALLQIVSPPGGPVAAAREETAYRLARHAFPLLAAGLMLGSYWGERAWGNFWNWDPKEMWGLAMALSCVIYFHFRAATGKRLRRANSALVLLVCAVILCTLLLANLGGLFPGLHSYSH